MDLSLILSVCALAGVAALLVLNRPRPFRPSWRVSGLRCWTDTRRVLRLDLQLTVANTGDRAGWLEGVTLEMDPAGQPRQLPPDSYWRADDQGTYRRSGDFHPLFIAGNRAVTRRVGFSTGQIMDLFPEGELPLKLTAALHRAHRPRAKHELSRVLSVRLDKKAAREEGARRSKKPGQNPLQSFNWEILKDIFQGRSKK